MFFQKEYCIAVRTFTGIDLRFRRERCQECQRNASTFEILMFLCLSYSDMFFVGKKQVKEEKRREEEENV